MKLYTNLTPYFIIKFRPNIYSLPTDYPQRFPVSIGYATATSSFFDRLHLIAYFPYQVLPLQQATNSFSTAYTSLHIYHINCFSYSKPRALFRPPTPPCIFSISIASATASHELFFDLLHLTAYFPYQLLQLQQATSSFSTAYT